MKRLLLLITTLALVAGAIVIPSTASASSSCKMRGSKTVKTIGNVRIFTHKQRLTGTKLTYQKYYACSRRVGKRFALARDDFPGEDAYSRYMVAGRYLAYEMAGSCGACSDPGQFIYLLNLRTGRESRGWQRTFVGTDNLTDCVLNAPEICDTEYVSVLLRPTGSFAMAIRLTPRDENTLMPQPQINVIAKVEFTPGSTNQQTTVLDRVTAADLASLRRDGTTLSWTNAGVAKTGTVN
jgi:hypothetical protein